MELLDANEPRKPTIATGLSHYTDRELLPRANIGVFRAPMAEHETQWALSQDDAKVWLVYSPACHAKTRQRLRWFPIYY